MSIILYDLACNEDHRFSPFCWRTRMALAHKGLDFETKPTKFTEIPDIGDGQFKTIPVIDEGGELTGGSLAIADHLEQKYPEKSKTEQASLFGGARGRSFAGFLSHWANANLVPGIGAQIILDIWRSLDPKDQDYFRQTREKRFGRPLEDVQADREKAKKDFAQKLAPLRAALEGQDFLGGGTPFYGDYACFAAFQWARVISPFPVLADDDPLHDWINRCLDLHDGLARAEKPASD